MAALKDGKVAKPQPKIAVSHSPKGKKSVSREAPKVVRFDDLPGRDEPGEKSEPAPRDVIVVRDQHEDTAGPSASRPANSPLDPVDAPDKSSDVDSQSPLRELVGKYDISKIWKFLGKVGAECRKTQPPQPRQCSLIRGMTQHHVQPFDIGSKLAKITLNVNFMALLQAAPSIRADLNRLMGPSVKNNRAHRQPMTPAQANPRAGDDVVAFIDTALTPDEIPHVRVAFVDALVDDQPCYVGQRKHYGSDIALFREAVGSAASSTGDTSASQACQ